MQEQAIIDGNKLIAEFLKYPEGFPHKIDDYGYEQTVEGFKIRTEDIALEDLKYHLSFDWLMPVVEKITNVLNYSVELNNLGANNWRFAIYSGGCLVCQSRLLETPIEATWSAVVEFIKWYNSCQK